MCNRLFSILIIVIGLLGCTQQKAAEVVSEEIPGKFVNLFGKQISLKEDRFFEELSQLDFIEIDSIYSDNSEFEYAVVAFGGVKFGVNPYVDDDGNISSVIFITSRDDEDAYYTLRKLIMQYYELWEDDEEEWRIVVENPNIRVRPLRSDEGGLTMIWQFDLPDDQ